VPEYATDASLQRAGLQRYAEEPETTAIVRDNTFCSQKPYMETNRDTGARQLRFPAFDRACLNLILGEQPAGHRFTTADQLHVIQWLQTSDTWKDDPPDGVNQLTTIYATQAGIVGRDFATLPTTSIVSKLDPFQVFLGQYIGSNPITNQDGVGNLLGPIGQIVAFLVDPDNWVAMGSLAVGGFMIVFGGSRLVRQA
jgi:hypothetical protein